MVPAQSCVAKNCSKFFVFRSFIVVSYARATDESLNWSTLLINHRNPELPVMLTASPALSSTNDLSTRREVVRKINYEKILCRTPRGVKKCMWSITIY